jgi:phage/plasmid primase-like uncharacterized protein
MMASQQVENLTEQFRQFVIAACDTDPGTIVADGRWHRFRIADTRHKGSKPGRYLLHLDGRANGIFMDWREGGKRHIWKADGTYEAIDRSEVARRREFRRVQQLREFQDAADEAAEYWKSCSALSDGLHPYLANKGVKLALGTRQGSGARFGLGDVPCVIVPLSSADGAPMSLQAIREDGERRFWPNSTHEGSHCLIGKDDGTSPIVFCEGFSTAASIHAATGLPVVMCVTSANMAAVARWAGNRWVGREMIVAGDDDWHLLEHPEAEAQRRQGSRAANGEDAAGPRRIPGHGWAGHRRRGRFQRYGARAGRGGGPRDIRPGGGGYRNRRRYRPHNLRQGARLPPNRLVDRQILRRSSADPLALRGLDTTRCARAICGHGRRWQEFHGAGYRA